VINLRRTEYLRTLLCRSFWLTCSEVRYSESSAKNQKKLKYRLTYNKRLSCRRDTARCAMSVEILSTAAQLRETEQTCNRWMTLKGTQGGQKCAPYSIGHIRFPIKCIETKQRRYLTSFPRYYHFYSVRHCLWPWKIPQLTTLNSATFPRVWELERFSFKQQMWPSRSLKVTAARPGSYPNSLK